MTHHNLTYWLECNKCRLYLPERNEPSEHSRKIPTHHFFYQIHDGNVTPLSRGVKR